jgi:hypothetical protein
MKQIKILIISTLAFTTTNAQQRILLLNKNNGLMHKTYIYSLPIDVTCYLRSNGQMQELTLTKVIGDTLCFGDSGEIRFEYNSFMYLYFHPENEHRLKRSKTLTRVGGITCLLLSFMPTNKGNSIMSGVFFTGGISLFLYSFSYNSKISKKLRGSRWYLQTI